MELLVNKNDELMEMTENLQDIMLSKVHSLLVVIIQKFSESDAELDLKLNIHKKKNIFHILDECICKMVDINFEGTPEIENTELTPNLEERIGDGLQQENEYNLNETMKYNLKLARKKINKLKQKNNELRARLTDENFKSKGLLRMAKYLTSKYHEHVKEINDKVLKIGKLEERNNLLERDLRKILNKLRAIGKHDTSSREDPQGQLKKCMRKQGIILEKMYLTEKNIAMVNSLLVNGADEKPNDIEMKTPIDILNDNNYSI